MHSYYIYNEGGMYWDDHKEGEMKDAQLHQYKMHAGRDVL